MIAIGSCGLMLEPQLGMKMDQLIGTAKLAEGLGFGYVLRSDHLLPTDNRRGLDSPECWTSLGAISASTSRIRFGPMVSPIGFRNPALIAKMACTLHSFSRGRLQLAVGAGWYEPEYAAHGFPFPPFKERFAQLREGVRVIESLVRDGKADFDGKYFSAHTDCLPRPDGKMGLVIGAKSDALVRFAARHGDEWNFLASPPDVFSRAKAQFDSARGARQVEVSEMGPFLLGRSQDDLEANASILIRKLGHQLTPKELVKRVRDRNGTCGTVEEFVEQVRKKADSGFSKLYFQTLVPENVPMLELLADTLKTRV